MAGTTGKRAGGDALSGRSDDAQFGRGDHARLGRRADALFGRGDDGRERRSAAKAFSSAASASAAGDGAKASSSAVSASDAGGGAEARGAQSGDSGGAAAQQGGDPGVVATADPVATGAQATEGSSGALPFTGSGVALLAAIGLLGIAAGLLLRRMTRRVTRAGA